VLLANAAAKVHAVDVGFGQLAWKLRCDARVAVHEKTNARYLDRTTVSDPIEALVCDASSSGWPRCCRPRSRYAPLAPGRSH